MNDITLIEKILREQIELLDDLQTILETDKRMTAADLQAILQNDADISEMIQKMKEAQ